jgi:hypothetical protein
MTDLEMKALVAEARARFEALTSEEQREHRRQQRISWVYGQLGCMRNGPVLTREQVAEIVDAHESDC